MDLLSDELDKAYQPPASFYYWPVFTLSGKGDNAAASERTYLRLRRMFPGTYGQPMSQKSRPY